MEVINAEREGIRRNSQVIYYQQANFNGERQLRLVAITILEYYYINLKQYITITTVNNIENIHHVLISQKIICRDIISNVVG